MIRCDLFLGHPLPSGKQLKAQSAVAFHAHGSWQKRSCARNFCCRGDAFLPSRLLLWSRCGKREHAPTFVLLAGLTHSEPRYASERRGSAFSGASGSMAKSKISPSANPGLEGSGTKAYSPGVRTCRREF